MQSTNHTLAINEAVSNSSPMTFRHEKNRAPALLFAWCLALQCNLSAVDVTIPTSSWISPMFLEGTTTTSVKVNGVSAHVLGGGHWFINQVLSAGQATTVSAIDTASSVSANVAWSPFVAATPAFSTTTLRVGDSLLLKALAVPIEVRRGSGVIATIQANATAPIQFRLPGIHTVTVSGAVKLTVTVVGFDVDLSPLAGKSLALQRTKTVTFTFPTAQTLDGMVVGTNCDAASLTVARVDPQKISLVSTVANVGAFPVWARVGSATGPIVLALPVQTYNLASVKEVVFPITAPVTDVLQTYLKSSAYAKTLPPDRLQVTIRLTPHRPDLLLNITRFAHGSTFIGGGSQFTVKTDGSASSLGEPGFVTKIVSGITVGEFTYTVFKPRSEVSTCIKVEAKQTAPEFSLIIPVSSN